ncbi:class I SAM-dependent methyltransferase [Methylobacterium aquaticum]|uniref:class I SAM-dependent methyltransferase n=1 Tax=Methylobacterium aquaticum TaxID=270351 RepID=UPI0018CD027D|nr:class I SAM-dependent methyltransferase [Methylobacterium aquaticum]
MTLGLPLENYRGLEIGALNNPIIPAGQGKMDYVDYTDCTGLKEQHRALPERVAGIVDVDYVWTGSGSLADVVGSRDVYDAIIASHVIEHVPNTLGWFRGVMDVLKPGGYFNLAIPDCRYTFDINCPVSTIGQMIEADMCNYRYPSIRQMFDHCVAIAKIEPGEIWRTPIDKSKVEPYNGEYALWLAESQAKSIFENGTYVDSHCWIYTPDSFLRLIRQASLLGRFEYELVNFHNTGQGEFEFFVSFMKPTEIIDAHDFKMRQCYAIDVRLNQLAEMRRLAKLAAE